MSVSADENSADRDVDHGETSPTCSQEAALKCPLTQFRGAVVVPEQGVSQKLADLKDAKLKVPMQTQ
jgi:hypothetical protein